jgi:hypothetical protein
MVSPQVKRQAVEVLRKVLGLGALIVYSFWRLT